MQLAQSHLEMNPWNTHESNRRKRERSNRNAKLKFFFVAFISCTSISFLSLFLQIHPPALATYSPILFTWKRLLQWIFGLVRGLCFLILHQYWALTRTPLGPPLVALCWGDPAALGLQAVPLHVLYQIIDEVGSGPGCRVFQTASFLPSSLSIRALQYCFCQSFTLWSKEQSGASSSVPLPTGSALLRCSWWEAGPVLPFWWPQDPLFHLLQGSKGEANWTY